MASDFLMSDAEAARTEAWVERLKERKEVRRDPAKAAARGLHWGGPVLESGITLIHNGMFYYRGRDALTRKQALEQALQRSKSN